MKKPKVVKAIVMFNNDMFPTAFIERIEAYGNGGRRENKTSAIHEVNFWKIGDMDLYEATITIGRKVKK